MDGENLKNTEALLCAAQAAFKEKTKRELYGAALAFGELEASSAFRLWLDSALECMYRQGLTAAAYLISNRAGNAISDAVKPILEQHDPDGCAMAAWMHTMFGKEST